MTYQQGKRWGVRRPREHNGYIEEWCPVRGRYVYQHRLVIERELGRFLEPTEVVHHKNQDPRDNRIKNLELTTHSEHMRGHAMRGETGWQKGEERPWQRKQLVPCPVCGSMFRPKRKDQADTKTCSWSCGQTLRYR